MLPQCNKVQSDRNGKTQSEIKLGAYFHSKYLVFVTKGYKTGKLNELVVCNSNAHSLYALGMRNVVCGH
jgi:hypothetical protein